MQPGTIAQCLLVLTLANGAPVIAKKIFGPRGAWPVDGGLMFVDGRPLFGTSKTFRGIALAILAAAAGAPVFGMAAETGAVMGAAAMAGDLFSSFVKRRLKFAPSQRATGLDQVPEALLPLLAVRTALGLTAIDIALTVTIFFVGEVLLSRLFYKWHIRDEPY